MSRRVLVTNDDGIRSPGLSALVEQLRRDFEVVVVAPEREQSAVGHSITLHKPLRMQPVRLEGMDVEAYETNGTPADCVVLGAVRAGSRPDLVVSGINAGANLGEELFYSGTVSAAVEAAIQGLPAFAVSVASRDDPLYEPAARLARRLAQAVLALGMPTGSLLNVNLPNLPEEELGALVITRLGRRSYSNQIEERRDPGGRPYFWFTGEPEEVDSGPGTDIGAVAEGRISVTPVHTDLSDYALIERLRDEEGGLAARLLEAEGDGR